MISRQWRGITKPGRAADYIRHLERETFPSLAKLPGFIGAAILKREVGEMTEFQIVTEWESLVTRVDRTLATHFASARPSA